MNFFSDLWEWLRGLFGGERMAPDTAGAHRLYVGNLSYKVKEEELRALFDKHGRVKTLHLIRDRLTRRLKGYAFLEMSPEDAQKALALNGKDFLGRKLVVSVAKTRKPAGERAPRRGGPGRWKKNRSGPRAYGAGNAGNKDNTPLPRYE